MAKNGKAGHPDAKQFKQYVDPFRVDGSGEFHLKSHKPGEKGDLDKDSANRIIDVNRGRLRDLQEKLYAHDRWSVLLIFQGMDAAGKDSAVEHVMSGINPQGCQVFSFKQPTSKELDHDFMWRSSIALPERGRIGIFNRSYYEELLVVRVHPQVLAQEKIPPELVTKNIWKERFEDISAFEKYLARNGTLILKFFLNVSKEEQRKRFLDRLEDPVADLVRKDPLFTRLGLDPAAYTEPEAVIALLLEEPALMQRPVLVKGDRAIIGRPPARVPEFLSD